jgi:hypothetical protein
MAQVCFSRRVGECIFLWHETLTKSTNDLDYAGNNEVAQPKFFQGGARYAIDENLHRRSVAA